MTAQPAEQPTVITKPDEIRILLNVAKASDSKRIQSLAEKILGLVDDLKTRVRDEQEKAAAEAKAKAEREKARADVERLQRQLAEAKAKLNGKPATVATIGPAAADVRAWARDNGVECPRTGRVPQHVVQAYLAAS